MAWLIEFDERAQKELLRLDRPIQRRILRYLETRVAPLADPTELGKSLVADLAGLWRYRVENYRIVCQLEQATRTVLVLAVGHRKDIYRHKAVARP